MTKILTTAVRCLATLALAMILPPWVAAVPVIFLSAAVAIAVVRDARGADRAASTLWDTNMQQVALSNDEARFGQVADDRIDDMVATNAERSTEFMKLYFDNAEFQKAIKEAARSRAYRIITDPVHDEALARLRAEMARKTSVLGRGET